MKARFQQDLSILDRIFATKKRNFRCNVLLVHCRNVVVAISPDTPNSENNEKIVEGIKEWITQGTKRTHMMSAILLIIVNCLAEPSIMDVICVRLPGQREAARGDEGEGGDRPRLHPHPQQLDVRRCQDDCESHL